jgi:hypothetical protein
MHHATMNDGQLTTGDPYRITMGIICYLSFQSVPDLSDYLSSSRCRYVSKVDIRLPGLVHDRMKLFGCGLIRISACSCTSKRMATVVLTDVTRPKISPVVGQILSRTSPVPPQLPSYTPGSSVVVGMSRADKTADALLDNALLRYVLCSVHVCSRERDLDKIIFWVSVVAP